MRSVEPVGDTIVTAGGDDGDDDDGAVLLPLPAHAAAVNVKAPKPMYLAH